MQGPTQTLPRPPSPPASAEQPSARWRARPNAAIAVRALILIVPLLASVFTSFVLASQWRRPGGLLPGIGWWLTVIALGTVTMLVVDRAARRFLPLSTLLRMSLTFPDEKPSRFGVALRSGTTRQLEQRLADVREHGLGATERDAAVTLLKLVAALREHDRLTRGHGERVRAYSALIGEQLGLGQEELSKLQWAGLIHDVGKLAVPSEILNKPGKLTDEEYDVIKTHPDEGMALVGPLAGWLGEWVLAVGDHHERWDGKGYPNGLAGTEISLSGRIVAVADVFDVITAARSYKTPRTPHEAREELARHAGTQFDPDVVRAFLEISIGDLQKSVLPMSWAAQIPVIGASIGGQVAGWVAPALLALGTALTGGGLAEAADVFGDDPPDELDRTGPDVPAPAGDTTTTTTTPDANGGTSGTLPPPTPPTATTVPGDGAADDGAGSGLPPIAPAGGSTTTVPGESGPGGPTTLPTATTVPTGGATTLPPTTLPTELTIPTTLPDLPDLTIPTTLPDLPDLTIPTTLPDLPDLLDVPDPTVPSTILPTTLPPLPTTTLPLPTTLPPTTLPPLPTTTSIPMP